MKLIGETIVYENEEEVKAIKHIAKTLLHEVKDARITGKVLETVTDIIDSVLDLEGEGTLSKGF